MSSPTNSAHAAWYTYGNAMTQITASSFSNQIGVYGGAGTGVSSTFMVYGDRYDRGMTDGEMISNLNAKGYRVLTRARQSLCGPKWADLYLNNPHPLDQTVKIRGVDGYKLPEGLNGAYIMQDGSILYLDEYGNYRIEDDDAKVTYKANRIREFNPYINASDLLESFIKEVGKLDGVKQTEVLGLPIEAFINWIILQAATKDGDRIDDLPTVQQALPPPPKKPKCVTCGRFIRKAWAAAKISFCSPEHMAKRLATI